MLTFDFRTVSWVAVPVLLALLGASPAARAEPPVAAPEAPGSSSPASPADGRFRLQPADDGALPHVPTRPRTTTEQNRVEALAWFMTGQLREKRNDFQGALEAYRKAVGLDPEAIEIYRYLVPLAFNLNQTDEAIKHALRAVELDPNDVLLLRRLGALMAARENIPQALELFEKAAASPDLDKKSAVYVSLMRDLGVIYAATGQTERAADALESVFDAIQNPRKYGLDLETRRVLEADRAQTLEQIGQVFLEAGRPERALEAFELASQSRNGRPGHLNYNMAQVYVQTKRYDEALDELQKYLDAQLQSKGPAAYRLLAEILEGMGRSDELIARLEALAEKDSRNATLQYFLAEQYVARDKLDEAEALYKETLSRTGGADGYFGLAAVYRRQGRAEELLDVLMKAVAGGQQLGRLESELQAIAADEALAQRLIAAGRELAKGSPPELDFPGSLILAQVAKEAEEIDAAVEFYRFAIKTRMGRSRAIALYQELGDLLFDARQHEQAVQVYRDALNDPNASDNKPYFLWRLSMVLELTGDTAAALEAVEEGQRMLPNSALFRFQEGWVHYHSRNWDKAVELLQKVIETHADENEIARRSKFIVSNIYVQQGEMRKGEEILEQVLAEDPDDPSVNNDLGYLYADQGKNLEQAKEMIQKAVEAEPENPAYLDSMGWVLFKLGEYEEALPWLQKAAELESGSDATILDHLGDCYDRLNKPEKAVDAWRQALEQAREERHPDQKLIDRIEEKLREHAEGAEALDSEDETAP